MPIKVRLIRDKVTKNYVKFKLEKNPYIEDFEKGIYIKKDSELADARAIVLTLEIEQDQPTTDSGES